MSSERWDQVNRLYDAALEMAEEARPAFLKSNCQGDEELRREVESLLAYDQQAQQFIDGSALQVTAKKLASDPPSLVGQKLGPYQLLNVLGAGGMGVVYKARDTRLNRTVAIKVLPRRLSDRADLRRRFEREARAVASLNHPHICTLYDVGKEGDTDFLVMEYLEGETLLQRLKRGPLSTEEVLRHAIEITRALEKAHGKGMIHRDLKPGNIMLTEGGAKLLDFGLAKQAGGGGVLRTRSDAGGNAHSTKSQSLTEEGMILGTLEYMAPEQLEGKEADARTDIFALGVVIYEMATGQKAFESHSKASLIAKILTFQPPPIGTIQPVSPPELDRVVQRCLAKKPEERWQSAAELTSELEQVAEANLQNLRAGRREKEQSGEAKEIEPQPEPAVPVAISQPLKVLPRRILSRRLGFFAIVLAGVLAGITGSLSLWRLRQQAEGPPGRPRDISLKSLTSYSWENPLDAAAISPDGKLLAYCSRGKLFVQIIHSGEKHSLPVPFYAFAVSWFPDGTKLLLSRAEHEWFQVKDQTIGRLECSLWSLSILGNSPRKIIDHAAGFSISPDGSLVAFERFNLEKQTVDIWVVGANGEDPHRIRDSSLADPIGSPLWSSSGQRLFYIGQDDTGRAIKSCDLGGGNVTTVFSPKEGHSLERGGYNFCWAPEGRILFSMDQDLWEVKVDEVTGQPLSQGRRLTQLSSFSTVIPSWLSMTADGRRLVLTKMNLQADVYLAETEAGGKSMRNPRRLTLDEKNDAVWDWMPDSRAVLFSSPRNGNEDIFKQDITSADAEAEAIVATPENEWHPTLSPDRAFILYLISEKSTGDSKRLMRVPVGGGPAELVLRGERISNFSCARQAKLCVLVEEVEGKRILSTFDPLTGRGEKLPIADYPQFARGILSPQGRLIEKMKSGPDGLYIRLRSLTGGPAEEVTFKNLIGNYYFHGWSVDGKGIYIWERDWSTFTSLYVALDGHSQVLWKRGANPGWWIDYPVPSPDGRYLACTIVTAESNAWAVENF